MDTTTSTTNEISLRTIMKDAVDGLFVIDRDRKISVFTEGCERFCGVDAASVIGTDCPSSEVTDGRDERGRNLSSVLCPAIRIFNGELQSYRQRVNLNGSNGQRVCAETTYSPIRDAQGSVTGVVGIMRDVSNVTEGENDPRGATAMATQGEVYDSPAADPNGSDDGKTGPLDQVLTSIERREILGALGRAKGQRTRAARLLGISRSRLYRRMEALGVDLATLGKPTSP